MHDQLSLNSIQKLHQESSVAIGKLVKKLVKERSGGAKVPSLEVRTFSADDYRNGNETDSLFKRYLNKDDHEFLMKYLEPFVKLIDAIGLEFKGFVLLENVSLSGSPDTRDAAKGYRDRGHIYFLTNSIEDTYFNFSTTILNSVDYGSLGFEQQPLTSNLKLAVSGSEHDYVVDLENGFHRTQLNESISLALAITDVLGLTMPGPLSPNGLFTRIPGFDIK